MKAYIQKKIQNIHLLFKIQQYGKAEQALLKLEQEYPGSFQKYELATDYAACLYRQNKIHETLKFLRESLSQNPKQTSLQHCLSVCLADIGAYSEASEAFKKAEKAFEEKEINLEMTWRQELASLKKAKGSIKESLEDFEYYLAMKTPSLESLLLIAKTYLEDEKAIRASELLEKHIKVYSTSSKAYILLGLSYYKQKALLKAQKAWRRALELNPRAKEPKVFLDRTL